MIARARHEILRRRHLRHVRPGRFGSFGAGSWIVPPLVVVGPEHVHLGERVFIDARAFLSAYPPADGPPASLRIGDGTRIGRDLVVACVHSVSIGRDVLLSERVFVGDSSHGYRDVGRPVLEQPMEPGRPVEIGDGAFLGIGCCVLPGVTVGRGAVVGANAVVTRDVPDHAVVAGNPARVVRRHDPATGEWTAP